MLIHSGQVVRAKKSLLDHEKCIVVAILRLARDSKLQALSRAAGPAQSARFLIWERHMNREVVQQWRLLLGEYDHCQARIDRVNSELAEHFRTAEYASGSLRSELILQRLDAAKLALAEVSKRMIHHVREFM